MNARSIPADVREHLQAGRKIDAVKALRAATGLDLKSSLAQVDACIDADPVLRQHFAQRRAELRGKARWLFVVAGVLVLGAAWLVFGGP